MAEIREPMPETTIEELDDQSLILALGDAVGATCNLFKTFAVCDMIRALSMHECIFCLPRLQVHQLSQPAVQQALLTEICGSLETQGNPHGPGTSIASERGVDRCDSDRWPQQSGKPVH